MEENYRWNPNREELIKEVIILEKFDENDQPEEDIEFWKMLAGMTNQEIKVYIRNLKKK